MPAADRRALALLLLTQACTVTAGELRLNNGAVLPGELASVKAKTLVWKADKIGEITVSKGDVTRLDTSRRVAVELAPDTTAKADCIVGVKDSVWSVDCAEQAPQVVALEELRSVPPATSSTGKFTTALDIDRGASPSEQLNLDLTAQWLRHTHRHKVDINVDYETSDGTTTNDDADANYQYDLLRDKGWFWYGRARYYRNKFQTLKEVYAVGPGIGRDFNPIDDVTLSVQGGPVAMYYFYDDQDGKTEPGGNLHWSTVWHTPWRGVEASHSGDLGWVFSVSDGYLFQTKTALTIPLYQGLIGEVRLDYDRTGLNADNGKKYDLAWVLGVGYKW
ncbi:MAG: DUF481 domain-containing protein [Halioglobus sp.]